MKLAILASAVLIIGINNAARSSPDLEPFISAIQECTSRSEDISIRYKCRRIISPEEILERKETLERVRKEREAVSASIAKQTGAPSYEQLIEYLTLHSKTSPDITYECGADKLGERFHGFEIGSAPHGRGPGATIHYFNDGQRFCALDETHRQVTIDAARADLPFSSGTWKDFVFKIQGVDFIEYLKSLSSLSVSVQEDHILVTGNNLTPLGKRSGHLKTEVRFNTQSLLPEKIVTYFVDGDARHVVEDRDIRYREVEGRMFPESSKMQLLSIKEDGRILPFLENEFELHEVTFKPSPQLFEIKIPADYLVTDLLSGESYKSGDQIKMIDDVVEKFNKTER